jgi:hypothetical protein
MDVTMCADTTCPKRATCYRNPASGTLPSLRQSWAAFPRVNEHCKSYWPISEEYADERLD